MAMRRRFRKGKRSQPYKKRAIIANALRKAKKQSIAKVVKSVLSRNLEVKCVTDPTTYVSVTNITSATTSLSGSYLVASPSNSAWGYTITNGTSNAQRIGNRVRTKRCILDYVVQPHPYNATTNPVLYPFIIRFYLFKNKIAPTSDPTATQITTQFLENGATMVGLTGSVMDLNRKLCSDTFTYLSHWDHYIGFSANNQNGNNIFQHSANNDFKMFAKGTKDLTKYMPKEVVFDDNGNVNTPPVFLLWQIISTGPNTYPLTNYPAFLSTNINYYYNDA